MKSKYITHLIFEGVDGVGKSTLSYEVWKKYNYRYRTYVRGELSDYVYAKKYNRQFIATQNNLPFLNVVLTASDAHILNNLKKREINEEELEKEKSKIKDKKLFMQAIEVFKHSRHIVVVDVTNLTIEKATDKIIKVCNNYIDNLSSDADLNQFNMMYKRGCDELEIKFDVKGNQPFMNDKLIMADAYLHNGEYETFSGESCQHNLIFSLAYSDFIDKPVFEIRQIDFCYPINSKILQRPEIYEYLSVLYMNEKSVLTSASKYIPNYDNIQTFDKCFGDDYIKAISHAKATIYSARELAALKMMTVRAYEAAIARQILFVDKESDKDCEILKAIHGNDSDIINLLYITPETIIQNYNTLMRSQKTIDLILDRQSDWYFEKKDKLLYSHKKESE